MDLTEDDIMKGWQNYTKELYRKDLYDPENNDGVITHLEPDVLECEVKWALGTITTNKASGGDRIPVEPICCKYVSGEIKYESPIYLKKKKR